MGSTEVLQRVLPGLLEIPHRNGIQEPESFFFPA